MFGFFFFFTQFNSATEVSKPPASLSKDVGQTDTLDISTVVKNIG